MARNYNKLGCHEISKDAASLSDDDEVKIIFFWSLRTTIAKSFVSYSDSIVVFSVTCSDGYTIIVKNKNQYYVLRISRLHYLLTS